MGVDCFRVNGFRFSVEEVAPNPANGVPDELLNENIGFIGSFCSESVAAGVGPVAEIVGGEFVVETFVDSTAGLRDGNPPNKPNGG